jgi:outer membrane protein assembly factor BamB
MVFSGISFAADWPCWRGPNSNGISTETGWNPKALTTPNITWRTHVGMGHSSLSVKGNYLYTMGNKTTKSGSETTYFDVVYCLDTRTGKEVWHYSYPCKNTNYPGPRSTPAVDDSFVYTLSWEGHLFCFNAKNGSVTWKRHLNDESLAARPGWGFCCSPVIDGNLLILNAGKTGIALNKKTGKVVWKSEPVQCGLPSPVLFNSNGKRLAAISNSNKLYAVDIKTGKIQWSHPRERMDIDPIIFDNKIFLQGYRKSRLVDINGGNPKLLIESSNLKFHGFLNFVIIDGYVYGFHAERSTDYLTCMDLKTGELKWRQNMGRYGAVIASNNKLIVLKGDGTLIAAEASPEAYKVISSAKILKMMDNTTVREQDRCYCWTIPALSDGKIYARNNYGEVVCVNMKM